MLSHRNRCCVLAYEDDGSPCATEDDALHGFSEDNRRREKISSMTPSHRANTHDWLVPERRKSVGNDLTSLRRTEPQWKRSARLTTPRESLIGNSTRTALLYRLLVNPKQPREYHLSRLPPVDSSTRPPAIPPRLPR
jgi:hypothetical protein